MGIPTVYLKDRNGQPYYPHAHALASYDRNGVTVQKRLDDLENALSMGNNWKETVDTYDTILTKYPNPEDGWTVNVEDTDVTYRFDGEKWIPISANSIPLASETLDGKMAKEDYIKLKNLKQGNKVSFTPSCPSGTTVGELKIDDTTYTLYAPLKSVPYLGSFGTKDDRGSEDNKAAITNGNVWINSTDGETILTKFSIQGVDGTLVYVDENSNVIKIKGGRDYSDFDGTASGLVPKPETQQEHLFLKSDGTWETIVLPENFTGCTSTEFGKKGLVPAPMANDQTKFLCADGTWKETSAGGSVDDTLSDTSTHPVQNKVITKEVNDLKDAIGDIPAVLDAINRKVV